MSGRTDSSTFFLAPTFASREEKSPSPGAKEDPRLLRLGLRLADRVEVDGRGDRAYHQKTGLIRIPSAERFHPQPDMAAETSWSLTMLHEIAHAAGGFGLRNPTNLATIAGFLSPVAIACAVGPGLLWIWERAFGAPSPYVVLFVVLSVAVAATCFTLVYNDVVEAFEEIVAEGCSVALAHDFGVLAPKHVPKNNLAYIHHHFVRLPALLRGRLVELSEREILRRRRIAGALFEVG